MSVRDEEQRKTNCPSRGLGLAAAAIGVGVGAALYYMFSKRTENPDSAGATSQNWTCEPEPQPLGRTNSDMLKTPESVKSYNSYITISETSTTDTSMNEDDYEYFNTPLDHFIYSVSSDDEYGAVNGIDSFQTAAIGEDETLDNYGSDVDDDDALDSNVTDDEETSYTEFRESDVSNYADAAIHETVSYESGDEEPSSDSADLDWNPGSGDSLETSYTVSDSEMTDWDVTDTSDVPYETPSSTPLPLLLDIAGGSPIDILFMRFVSQSVGMQTDEKNRERSWSLEECAICYEIMLKDQSLLSLPCTHNFHMQCIEPWLQERQTCPVCRKAV